MRHRKKINHLGRKSAHRKSMIANMASSLILHKRITTTLAKAKALRTYVEPLITRSKEDTTHSRRMVFRVLQNKEAVTELFREVSTKVAERPGGYTRIIKLGPRQGDSAEMAMIELVDFNQNLLGEQSAKAKSTRRGRRGAKKAEGTDTVATPKTKEKPVVEKAEEVKAKEPKATVEETVAEVEEPVAEVEEALAEVEEPAAEVEETVAEVEEPVAEATEETTAEADEKPEAPDIEPETPEDTKA